MSVVPLRDFVVVVKDEPVKTTVSGLHIVSHEEKIVSGVVQAIGSGKLTLDGSVVPLEVNVGDKVLFNKNFATEIKDGEVTLLLLKEENLLAISK